MTAERLRVLRNFGLVLGTAFGLLDAFLYWRGRPSAPVFFGISAFFFLGAFLFPAKLDKFEIYWMKFAEKLSVVMTFLILTLTFIVAIIPLGLFLRLIGKDLLNLKIKKEDKSYWIPVPSDAPGTRPYLPY